MLDGGRRCNMYFILRWMALAMFFVSALPLVGMADTVILNSGETFDSPQIWEEQEYIRFNMHGLLVRVKKNDVREIVRTAADNSLAQAEKTLLPPFRSEQKVPNQPAGHDIGVTDTPPSLPLDRPSSPSNAASPPPTRSIAGTGLNGLTWKVPPASIPGLVKMKTEPCYGGIDQYRRPQDDLQLGTATLDGMVYGFWQDQLYVIMMWVEGSRGYQRLKETVRAYYGGGEKSTSVPERYLWKDPDTDRMLEFDSQLNTGIFWMRSQGLDQQIKHLYPE
jgi:hypothetical protein